MIHMVIHDNLFYIPYYTGYDGWANGDGMGYGIAYDYYGYGDGDCFGDGFLNCTSMSFGDGSGDGFLEGYGCGDGAGIGDKYDRS